jgi:hypothetical protein
MCLRFDGVDTYYAGIKFDVLSSIKVVFSSRVSSAFGVSQDELDAIARKDTIVGIFEAQTGDFAVGLAISFSGLGCVKFRFGGHGFNLGVGEKVVLFPFIPVHGLDGRQVDTGECRGQGCAAHRCNVITHDHGKLNRVGVVSGVVSHLVPQHELTTGVPVHVAGFRVIRTCVHGVALSIGCGAREHGLGESRREREDTSPFISHNFVGQVAFMVVACPSHRQGASLRIVCEDVALLGVHFMRGTAFVSAAVLFSTHVTCVVKIRSTAFKKHVPIRLLVTVVVGCEAFFCAINPNLNSLPTLGRGMFCQVKGDHGPLIVSCPCSCAERTKGDQLHREAS